MALSPAHSSHSTQWGTASPVPACSSSVVEAPRSTLRSRALEGTNAPSTDAAAAANDGGGGATYARFSSAKTRGAEVEKPSMAPFA